MSLAETQRRLWRLVTAPAGVAQALREESASSIVPLGEVILSDERASSIERLDVYANAYFYRIHAALTQDYPALAAALGDDVFHDAVTSYLLVHPPTEPSLRYAGAPLSDFLSSHDAAAGVRSRAPWAADLARFEWTMIDAFDAANSPALSRERVAANPPEAFADLPLALRPDVRFIELDWPVSAMRTAHDSGEHPIPALSPPPSSSAPFERKRDRDSRPGSESDAPPEWRHNSELVWRPLERVRYRAVSLEESVVLPRLARGTTFGEVCEVLAVAGDEQTAPARAAGLLERWLADAILIDLG